MSALAVGVDICQPVSVETLGQRLKSARERANLGTNELTRRAGISAGVVTRLEQGKGKRPGHEVLAKLASVLGVRPDWLATGEGSPEPNMMELNSARGGSKAMTKVDAVRSESAPETIVVDDDVEWLIDQAFVVGSHHSLDVRAVRAFAQSRAPKMKRDVDMVRVFTDWLNAAATIRERGEVAEYMPMLLELTKGYHEYVDENGKSEDDLLGEEQYRRQTGREPPGWAGPRKPGEPILLAPGDRPGAPELPEDSPEAKAKARAASAEGHTPKPGSAVRKKEKR